MPALSCSTPYFWLSQIVVVRNEEGERARQGNAGDFSEHSLPDQLRQPFSKRIFPSFGHDSQLPCSSGAKKRDKVAGSDRFGENWAPLLQAMSSLLGCSAELPENLKSRLIASSSASNFPAHAPNTQKASIAGLPFNTKDIL
ncbi:hypothetical protein Ddc_03199 [Ditylenchus destructor]|nr:hypothetical protein Ddc_03199 [Ditylenchus destructor]